MIDEVNFLNAFEGCNFHADCYAKHGYGSGNGLLPAGKGNYLENAFCVAPALPYYFRNELDNELTGLGNPNNAATPSEV